MADIVSFSESKYGYYTDRRWDADRQRWQFVKAPIVLAEHHKRILRHCFSVDADGRLPYHSVAVCDTAKSGKTCLSALIHLFFSLHVEPGSEQFVIANKQNQARSRAYTALTNAIKWNPYLHIKPNRYELRLRNGTTVKAIPSNARTEAGASFTLASFDEPWAIVYEDGERLVSEFKPNPVANASCKLLTGYGGYSSESSLWGNLLADGLNGQPVDELADIGNGRGEPACWRNGRLFVYWNHFGQRQPWHTDSWLSDMQSALTAGEFARQVFCDFASSSEAFIQEIWWKRCIDTTIPPMTGHASGELDAAKRRFQGQSMIGEPLVIGLDASVSGDCTALIGVTRDPSNPDNRVAVRYCKIWNPADQPTGEIIQSQTIEPTLRELIENFNVVCIAFDVFQLAKLYQDLRHLCYWKPFSQHASREVADKFLRDAILEGSIIDGTGDPGLESHITGAAMKTTGDSKLRIIRKGGPVDAAVALSMAHWTCKNLNL